MTFVFSTHDEKIMERATRLFIYVTVRLNWTSSSNMFRTAIALLIVAAANPSQAEINVSGYLKSFAVVQDELDNPVFQADRIYQSQNSARLMLDGFSGNITWQLHYELSPVFVSDSLPVGIPTFSIVDGNYRFSDPDPNLLDDDDKNPLFQNLDRSEFPGPDGCGRPYRWQAGYLVRLGQNH